MNELQQRILTVLRNVGGSATTEIIRQRGNIAKPPGVIECNLRSLQRESKVAVNGQIWFIPKPVPIKPDTANRRKRGETRAMIIEILRDNPKAKKADIARELAITPATVQFHMDKILGPPDSDVGSIEDQVDTEAAVYTLADAFPRAADAMDAMRCLASRDDPPRRHIENFQLKYDILKRIELIMAPDIAQLVKEIADDLAHLHTFDETT